MMDNNSNWDIQQVNAEEIFEYRILTIALNLIDAFNNFNGFYIARVVTCFAPMQL